MNPEIFKEGRCDRKWFALVTVLGRRGKLAVLKRCSDPPGFSDQLSQSSAGDVSAADIAYLVAIAGIFAYSRDMEREADDIGFEFMADAGYDFHEAANIWQALIEERDAADQPDQFILFASHPTTSERVNTLQKMADQLESQGRYGESYQGEYLDATRPFRAKWLKNELRKRDFAASQVVLKHLFNTGDRPGELYYYQGELYRMRAQEGDVEKAIASYQKALSYEQYPPAVLRSLGMLFWKARKFEDAKDSFMKGTGAQTIHLRPFKFGNHPGFRFELSFLSQEGLEYEGFVVGTIKDDKLYLICYTGTRQYYYPKYKESVEQIIASIDMP